MGLLESQYNKLLDVNWEVIFQKELENIDTYEFWAAVFDKKNASRQYAFGELALFAFNVLVLPTSNASAERVFSIMNAIKSKVKSRMLLKLLNSILRIKMRCYALGICCNSLEITEKIVRDHNSAVVYQNQSSGLQETLSEDDIAAIDEISQEFNIPCIHLQE